MNTVTIRDLPQMKELDKQTMADTSGGYLWFVPRIRLLPYVAPRNNVNFGSNNSLAGINVGVNEGSISGNTFNF